MSSKQSKNTQKKRSPLAWLFGVIALCCMAFVISVYATAFAKTHKKPSLLTVKTGDTYYSLLVSKPWQTNALSSSLIARLYLKFHATDKLEQGVYRIPANASLQDVVNILGKGAEVALIKVQIIEGKTSKDLYHTIKTTHGIQLETLSAPQSATDSYTWQDVMRDNAAVAKALQIDTPSGNLEGLFAPDTYFFEQGVTDTAVLKRLYDSQQSILDKAWAERSDNLPYRTPYEALIMASIIEKETGITSERPDVSAVFVNRLRQGMRLQTDPTIIYGLFDRYDGKIYRSNINEKTTYNTYQIDGLPPTPIALPSKEAINAAMHPSNVPYTYFVATGNGGHKFSTSLAEHNKAVSEYRATIAKKP
ncbi:MAG: endolytic transglycosylase MltG [Moraxella sp.]|nr:endolytic transglycosylase MltG [Moraxella sp.]